MRITKTEAELYQIRAGKGSFTWGDIVLVCGHESVSVMARSDFGSFDFHWSHCGGDPKEFLCSLGFQYAMTKLTNYKLFIPDPSKYGEEIKRRIIEARMNCGLSKEKAREAWNEMLEIYDEFHEGDLFYRELVEHRLFNDVFGDYEALPSSTMPDPHAVSFWNEVWLPFIDNLKSEIKKAA